ncbi:MAG: TlpA disulfide reductase family protein [Candidimonas sp.]|jgi:thiol-disulfide isomerase/thioredoxin
MRRRDFIGGAALAAAWTVPAAIPWARALAASAHPFYQMSYSGLDDKPVALSQFLGKPLAVNFWATWCAPCVKEMPDLDALQKAHPYVRIIGVAVDTEKNVNKFIQKVPVSYPLLVAGYGGIQQMKELGNAKGGLPYTVVFNGRGELTHRMLGQIDPEKFGAILGDLA